ncbi:MAG: LacI family DNA-binding transcriptional regulator [Kiritimatiellales bacterium]
MAKVSQKQIAEKLGVSIALVSRVLSGKAEEIGITPATIQRVLKTAAEMGYVPSAAALSLKGKPTRTVGVAVYDFNDPFFGALIRQIQTEAHRHNYSLVLAGFLNRVPTEQDLQPLHKHFIDGLIILGSDMNAPWLNDFKKFPVARIGHGAGNEHSLRVAIDETDAAQQLITHLKTRRIKKIICPEDNLPVHRLRCDALTAAAKAAGIQTGSLPPADCEPFSAGESAVEKIRQKPLPENCAVVCINDQFAMGLIHELIAAGISVPQQICVTGFDDIPAAAQFIPALTTIQQPITQMVQRAFQHILKPEPLKSVYLSGRLVVRESA